MLPPRDDGYWYTPRIHANGAICDVCVAELPYPALEDLDSVRDLLNLAQYIDHGIFVCDEHRKQTNQGEQP